MTRRGADASASLAQTVAASSPDDRAARVILVNPAFDRAAASAQMRKRAAGKFKGNGNAAGFSEKAPGIMSARIEAGVLKRLALIADASAGDAELLPAREAATSAGPADTKKKSGPWRPGQTDQDIGEFRKRRLSLQSLIFQR